MVLQSLADLGSDTNLLLLGLLLAILTLSLCITRTTKNGEVDEAAIWCLRSYGL
jgi:hypothetical protein